jgi:hypothetical protein
MKKTLIASLIAVPLLSLSSMAFAAEPLLLTEAQMDAVTAGDYDTFHAYVLQFNASPVTLVQVNALTLYGGNSAYIKSGNFSYLHQQ